MPGKRVLLKHKIESGVQFIGRNLPRDKRTLRQIGRHQCLPDAPDRSRPQHRLYALDNGYCRHFRPNGDFPYRVSQKSLYLIFRYGQNSRIGLVVNLRGQRHCVHVIIVPQL